MISVLGFTDRSEESLLNKEWKLSDVQSAVVELLREMNQSKLAKLSPLSQVIGVYNWIFFY